MTTVDEAREALLRNGNPLGMVATFEAAIRAECDEWSERTAEAEQGWGKALEQLETAEATLRALREALGPVLVEADELIENDRWADGPPNSVIIRLEYAVIALRAALAATPAEDEETLVRNLGKYGEVEE